MENDNRHPRSAVTNFHNDTRLVRFTIGRVKAEFVIHTRLICKSSLLVKNHYKHARKDLQIIAMPRLIGTSPEIFNIYFNWLYSGKLHCMEEGGGNDEDNGGVNIKPPPVAEEDPEYQTLARLYQLAITLKDSCFQNSILSAFLTKIESPPPHPAKYPRLPGNFTIDTFFKHCGTESEGLLGREMLVKVWVRYAGPLEHLEIRERGFVDMVLGELMRGRVGEGGEEGVGLERGRFMLHAGK